MFLENSTAALILVKRKSSVGSLRIAAVVLGGLAPTSPHDDANKTGSVGREGEHINVSVFFFSLYFTFAKQGTKRRGERGKEREIEMGDGTHSSVASS